MIKLNPAINSANIAAKRIFVPLGALSNSLQIKTPQTAETNVAPLPQPICNRRSGST